MLPSGHQPIAPPSATRCHLRPILRRRCACNRVRTSPSPPLSSDEMASSWPRHLRRHRACDSLVSPMCAACPAAQCGVERGA
eukprot:7185234-Prymnesium_polylepis.1